MLAGAENSTESYQSQVRRILQSKAFRTSEVHRNLLNYLAEKSIAGEADSLKEYTVGLDVFAKPESYDPRQESVVRMHMARLRQKLAEYYRTEGLDDPIIVDLPKGGFKVTFEARPIAVERETPHPQVISLPTPPSYKIELILGALLLVAVAAASYFGLKLRQVEKAVPVSSGTSGWTPELQELWSPLLSPDRPLVVVLSTQQSTNMTGISAANGAFLLGQFLADRKQNVYVTGSEDLSMPDIIMGNLVFLGPATGNRQLQALPRRSELVIEATGVRNLHPAAGEPDFLPNPPPRTAQGTVDESFALITHAPGVNGKGDVLYLSGSAASSPTAGVEAFTDPSLAKTLVEKMRKPDGKLPRYYQIVLKVRSMDETPIEILYVMHKELK
jgi:hypothetical protein